MELNIHCRWLSTSCKHHLSVVNLGTGEALDTSIWGKVDVHTHRLKTLHCKTPPWVQLQHVLTTFWDFSFIHWVWAFWLSQVFVPVSNRHMGATHLVIGYLPCETSSWVSRKASFMCLGRNVLIQHRLTTAKHFCASWLETHQPRKTLVDWRPPRRSAEKPAENISEYHVLPVFPPLPPQRASTHHFKALQAPKCHGKQPAPALPTHMFSLANPKRVNWNHSLGEKLLCCYPSTYSSHYHQFLAVAF